MNMNFSDFGIDSASLAGSLETRLSAARAAGFAQMMISAADIVGHPLSSDAAVHSICQSGLRVSGLEALRDFEGLHGKLHDYKVDVAKSMLSLCSRINARLLLVEASALTHAQTDPEHLARDLNKLATLALPLGIRIAFKALSNSRTVQNFAQAAEFIALTQSPNLGLALDVFDLIAAGTPLNDLELLFPQQIFLVQLSDFMLQETPSEREPSSATGFSKSSCASVQTPFRVFPGEGVHSESLAQWVEKLEEIGYFGHYSFDVYNSDYLQMPAELIAQRARIAADWLGETVLRRSLPVPNMAALRQR